MATQRRLILEAIRTRARRISLVNGFATDAGEKVIFGERPILGPDDPAQALAVVVEDEQQGWQMPGKAGEVLLPVTFVAVARVDTQDACTAVWLAEDLIGDAQLAMEADANLGGLTQWPIERGPVRTFRRETGSVNVGASVTYRIRFKRGFGQP